MEGLSGRHTGPGGGSIGSHLLLVSPQHRVEPVLQTLLQETNVLYRLSVLERTHPRQLEGVVPDPLKVVPEKLIEHLHVSLLLELNVVGKVLQNLHR